MKAAFVREDISTEKVDLAIRRRRQQAQMKAIIVACKYILAANLVFAVIYGVF